jgi:uncharacterized membrane protein YccC
LQCAIWLVISTAYPAHGLEALSRGALILAGGLLQTALVAIWCRVETGGRCPGATSGVGLDYRASRIFAVRAAITLAIAATLYRLLPQQNSYWIPMTAVIVLRPDRYQTVNRGVARVAGTVAGAALGTVIVRLLPSGFSQIISSQGILAACLVLSAGASYALFQVNYAYYALFLTGYVVFLLSLAGLGTEALIFHRALFTVMGGALPLATHWAAERLEEY